MTAPNHAVILSRMPTVSAKNAEIIPAATVILVSDRDGKLQVYLLKRNPRSRFMAGYFVFPGGTVDRRDRRFDLFSRNCDLACDAIFSRFGPELTEAQALAYCVAAIREIFEEAGVCLFQRDNLQPIDLNCINRLRTSTGLKKDWLLKFAAADKCRLALSSLARWSHWITPELMTRRFDTRFFLADMPANQFCLPDECETVQGVWLSPAKALAGNLAGKIPLSPPTLVTLHELLKYTSVNNLQTENRRRPWGQARLPRLVPLPNSAVIVQPWDPLYHQEKIDIDLQSLPAMVLSVGESFSRIWCDNGIWKPIRAKVSS